MNNKSKSTAKNQFGLDSDTLAQLIRRAWKIAISKDSFLTHFDSLTLSPRTSRPRPKFQNLPLIFYMLSSHVPYPKLQTSNKIALLGCVTDLLSPSNVLCALPMLARLVAGDRARLSSSLSKSAKDKYDLEVAKHSLKFEVVEGAEVSLLVGLKAEKCIWKKSLLVHFICKAPSGKNNSVSKLIAALGRMTKIWSIFMVSGKSAESEEKIAKLAQLDSFSEDLLRQVYYAVQLSQKDRPDEARFCEIIQSSEHIFTSPEFWGRNELLMHKTLLHFMSTTLDILLCLLLGFRDSDTLTLAFLFEKDLVNRGLIASLGNLIKFVVYHGRDSSTDANSDPIVRQMPILTKSLQILAVLSYTQNQKVLDQFVQMKILLLIKQTDQFLGAQGQQEGVGLCRAILDHVLGRLRRTELRNPLVMNLLNYVYMCEEHPDKWLS